MSFKDREIVVENDDTDITYLGEWTTVQSSVVNGFGNFGPALSATLRTTKSISSFSFPFHGSSITVVGSINIANWSTDPNPTWQCILDDIDLEAPNIFQFPENNWSLCNQTSFPDGAHELVVKVTSNGMPFYLDYIKYRPSTNVSLENTLIWIENVDPAVDYISGWGSLGGTANQTTDPKGLVNVTFVGVQLSWYGFVPTEKPHNASSGEYSIDGQFFSSFQLLGLPPGNIPTTYNQLFFVTPNLEMGTHTLSVKYTGSPGQTPFTLDYLIVSNGSLASSSPGRSTAPTPTNGGGGTSTPTLPNDRGNTSVPTSQTSLNVRAIVGGVVGGIGGVVICSIILFIWLKYPRRADERDHDGTRRSLIQPFLQPESTDVSQSASLTANRASINDGALATTSLTSSKYPSQPSISQTRGSAILIVSSSSVPPSTSTNLTSPFPSTIDDTLFDGIPLPTSSNGRPLPPTFPTQMIPPIPSSVDVETHIQYEDSGIRLPHSAGIIEIPPSYSEH